jgi:hypothetical protein
MWLSCAYGFLWRSERIKEIAKTERAKTKGKEESAVKETFWYLLLP